MSTDEGKDEDVVVLDGEDEVSAPVEETVSAPSPLPAHAPPQDLMHLHRRFEHLLSVLEQTGACPSHEREHIRRVP